METVTVIIFLKKLKNTSNTWSGWYALKIRTLLDNIGRRLRIYASRKVDDFILKYEVKVENIAINNANVLRNLYAGDKIHL